MPQILSNNGTWYPISDVISREDGRIMSFKLNTRDHGEVTVEANLSWEDWQTFTNFLARSGGGASIGAAFGPIGAIVGGAAGIISFFKSYDQHTPGYLHRASGSHYFDRYFNTRDSSTYRP